MGTPMAEPPQPTCMPEVADFLGYIQDARVLALGPLSPSVSRPFIPTHVLQSYLTPPRIRDLLRCVCRPHSDWETIRNGYLAIFAVLIVINKGTYIAYFIQSHNLTDAHLPFRHSEDWPADCVEFFSDFKQAQWQFCAQPLIRHGLNHGLSGTRFQDELVLPIVAISQLKSGVDSITYKVEVEPSYNHLADRDENGRPITNIFFLKTCQAKDVAYYHREVEGYKALMYQNDVSCYMAKFYGSWVQGGIYHILVEYVEGGTLANFFRSAEPPTREEDIMKFWSNLLDLIKIVKRIHELPLANKEYLQGIHHDIKPENILVSKRLGPSRYDVTFKLADLGLADFQTKLRKGEEVASRDRQGTQTYTAPEYCRDDPFLEHTILSAKPSKDIWALGCVWSEAAVWSVFGKDGLNEYSVLRTAATNKIPNFQDSAYSGCFHDGARVLEAVTHMHIRLRQERRHNDHVINDILSVIEDMLEEVSARLDAATIYRRIRKALAIAKGWSKEPGKEADDDCFPEVFRGSSTPNFVRHPPPELPLEGPDETGLGLSLSQSPQSMTDHFPNGILGAMAMSPNSPTTTTHDIEERRRSISSKNVSFRSLNRDSHASAFSEPSHLPRHSRQLSHRSLNQNHPTPILRSSQSNDRYPNGQHIPVPDAENAHEDALRAGENVLQSPTSAAEEYGVTKTRHNLPEVSVNEALSWIDSDKERRKFWKGRSNVAPLNGSECRKRLHGRDQIFLIDDSASMKEHWPDVKRVFKALAYLVKKSDLDGMDLSFTNSPDEGHSEKTSTLLKSLDEIVPSGQCDMKMALGMILERLHPVLERYHSENLREQERKQKKFSKKKKKKKRGVTIYVFTDGVWQDRPDLCGVEEPIKTIVDKLNSEGMMKCHVGIQFIRFGTHTLGGSRLKRLDSRLRRDYGITKDIVDTEDANGNVWKMLLGSFDDYWDGDSEENLLEIDLEKRG